MKIFRCGLCAVGVAGLALLARSTLADPPGTTQPARPTSAAPAAQLAGSVEALLKESGPQRDQAIEAVSRLAPPLKELVIGELCRLTLNARSREPALRALKKVSPQLFEPVRALTNPPDGFSHANAFRAFQGLGAAGRPAFPVLLWATERTEAEFHKCARLQNAQAIWFEVNIAHTTLGSLACQDDRAFQALLERVNFGLDDKGRQRYDEVPEFLMAGEGSPAGLLAKIAQAVPARRPQVVKLLVRQLELPGEARVMRAIQGLEHCGAAAKPALAALAKLEIAPSAGGGLQKAATAAIRNIEGMVRAEARFGPDPSLRLLCENCGDTSDPFISAVARDLLGRKHSKLGYLAERLFGAEGKGIYEGGGDEVRGKIIEEVGKSGLEPEAITALLLGHLSHMERHRPKTDPAQGAGRILTNIGLNEEYLINRESLRFQILTDKHLQVLARATPKHPEVRKLLAERSLQWFKAGRAAARKTHKGYDYSVSSRPRRDGQQLGQDMVAILVADDLTVPNAVLKTAEDLISEMQAESKLGLQNVSGKTQAELACTLDVLSEMVTAQPKTRKRATELLIGILRAIGARHLYWDGSAGLSSLTNLTEKCGPEVMTPLEEMIKEFPSSRGDGANDIYTITGSAVRKFEEARRLKAEEEAEKKRSER